MTKPSVTKERTVIAKAKATVSDWSVSTMLVSEFEDMKPAESVGWRVAVGAGLATVGFAVTAGLAATATATATTTATALVWLFGGSIGGRLACRRFIDRRITVVR
jgi:hypothetical protein